MNAQQVLCQYVDKYLQLSSRLGADSGKVTEAYGKLRDLLLMELYFMKSVRIIIPEEELSGFVIYIENKLRGIVDSYQPEKSGFMPYFKHIMEYRALSYLSEIQRHRLTASAYESYYMCHAEEVAERSPEDLYMEDLEKAEFERKRKKLLERLRYVCSCRPSRRRNLFILLCTLLPYLPYDAVDDFCKALNCDRVQTFAIADYLCSVQASGERIRGSRTYNRNRKDYLWMRKMEMEYVFDRSDRRNENLSADICKTSALISNIDSEKRKMNVEYPVLGELLNMEPSSISCAVYCSRKLLSVILGEGSQSSYMAKEARSASGRKSVKLDRFEPFAVFGIVRIKKTGSLADAS